MIDFFSIDIKLIDRLHVHCVLVVKTYKFIYPFVTFLIHQNTEFVEENNCCMIILLMYGHAYL